MQEFFHNFFFIFYKIYARMVLFILVHLQFGSVAQLVEQRPEEPCVTGSSPVGTTIFIV